MNKFELKFWHPVAGFALTKFLQILNQNLIQSEFQPFFSEIITWLENLFVVLIFYIIIRNIYRSIMGEPINTVDYDFKYQHAEPPQLSEMEQINRDLDEIEATLNALADAENSDGKITPIWNAKPPKR